MRNLILSPYLLYLVNTQRVECSGAIECPKIQIYPERKNVAVMEVSNYFFELEKIKGHGLLLGRKIPIRESNKEFIDITTFQKFPFERDFDFEHANLDSIRSAYRKHKIVNLGDLSAFGIEKLYHGTVSISDSSSFKNFAICEFGASFPKIDAYFLQFEGNKMMTLRSFLMGKDLSSALALGDAIKHGLVFHLTEEIPLEELKEISTSYLDEERRKTKLRV